MKNFNIDSVLKTTTVLGYLCVYLVAGYSAVGLLRTQSTKTSTKQEVSDQSVTTRTTPTQEVTPPPQKTSTSEKKVQPTPTVVERTDTPIPTPDTRCIISVDGTSYNITDFRQEHSGGDIFTCGADMSATFHGQHDTQMLQKMNRYKI